MYTLVFVLLYCTCLTFLQHWVLVVFYVQVQVINITIPTHLDFTNGAYEYSTDNGTVHLANMIKPTLPSISLFHGLLLLILVAHCLGKLVRWRPVRTSPGELSPPPGSSCRSLGPLRCFPICRHTLLETTSFFFPTR